MDINLPGISGIEALRILADDPATAHIPVVALSANAMPRDIEKGLEAGFFRYLTKPIKVNEFMDTLDLALKFATAHSTVATRGGHQMRIDADILAAGILIVDDQEPNVSLLSQLLADAGYTQVASTMDPKEVCALHRKHRYDLILLDLQMPGMDGFQVMEGLKTNESDGYLPVIVLTAQPGHKLRALQAGAKDFISKPFDLVEVKTRIHNMLEVQAAVQEARELQQGTGADGAGTDRRAARKRSALQEPRRTCLRLVLGAGRFRQLHEDIRSGPRNAGHAGRHAGGSAPGTQVAGWDEAERADLQARIANRQPFLDFLFNRVNPDGSHQQFRVSGEPMFNQSSRFIGYRGIGVEVLTPN